MRKSGWIIIFALLVLISLNFVSFKVGETEGYYDGNQHGTKVGYKTGYTVGNQDGQKIGYEDGHATGYQEGEKKGFDSGYELGYNKGETQGKFLGEEIGYKTGYEEGNAKGQKEGYNEALRRSVSLRNPTYEELRVFLVRDKTNLNTWVGGKYVCGDFAADLNNNAEKEGIRAGIAWLVYNHPQDGKWGHFINCFKTSDHGLIFIEPETDGEVEVRVGKVYWGYTIREIIIFW